MHPVCMLYTLFSGILLAKIISKLFQASVGLTYGGFSAKVDQSTKQPADKSYSSHHIGLLKIAKMVPVTVYKKKI